MFFYSYHLPFCQMRVGIDASTIGIGGGLHHLIELLSVANPTQVGVNSIIIWGNHRVVNSLPNKPWLLKIPVKALNHSLFHKYWWRYWHLPSIAHSQCDILFSPTAGLSHFHPYVSMCQNQLVFDTTERKRYGFSWSRLRIELLTFLQKKSFRWAEGVIFLTEFSKQSAGKLQGVTQVIPHGINSIFLHKPINQEVVNFKILYPSSIDLYKYQWNVAKAVLNLKTKGFNITLELVGAVLNQKALQLIKPFLSSVPETIHYRGEVGFEEMQQYYQDSDIVVFASSCETFGMILLEAMAMGKPIACSDRSSMPETLGEAGVYFDPSDVTSIENALELLLTNPALREKIADLAHQKALTYSWERCANQTFQFLADVYQHYKQKN